MVIFSALSLRAGSERTLHRLFSVSNLYQYAGYTFYFYYQTYPHHNSMQKGETVKTFIYPENTYRGGDYPTAVYLEATDSSGNLFRSNILVGGKYLTRDEAVESVLDYFEITGIDSHGLHIQYQQEKVFRSDGTAAMQTNSITGRVIAPGSILKTAIMFSPLLFGLTVGFFMYIRIKMQERFGRSYFEEESFLQKE